MSQGKQFSDFILTKKDELPLKSPRRLTQYDFGTGFGSSSSVKPVEQNDEANYKRKKSDSINLPDKTKQLKLQVPKASVQSFPNEAQTLDGLLKEKEQEIKLIFAKWRNIWSEHESFEKIFPARLDEIKKDVLHQEDTLKKQKEKLGENINMLSNFLKKN